MGEGCAQVRDPDQDVPDGLVRQREIAPCLDVVRVGGAKRLKEAQFFAELL